jgi:hypothetical protein
MERVFINNVLAQVKKRMKTFEVPGCRQSRRIEGMFNRDDEMHGFKNLCIYVHTALTGQEDIIAEILSQVDAFIYGRDHYNHTRWLMYFGSDPVKLFAPVPSRVFQAIRAAIWRDTITRGFADYPCTGLDIIPRMHNPGSLNTHFPERYDLALFFCKGKNIITSEPQQKNFTAIRMQSLWFFFGDDDTPELESGGFIPAYQCH